MDVRPMQGGRELAQCAFMIFNEWGADAADRFREQATEYLRNGPYSPKFIVATLDGNAGLLGVAAYHRTMTMNADYDLIWVCVHPDYQRGGVGKLLTEKRLEFIRLAGGTSVKCVTQKPGFFSKFGFHDVADYGNGWRLMLKLFAKSEM